MIPRSALHRNPRAALRWPWHGRNRPPSPSQPYDLSGGVTHVIRYEDGLWHLQLLAARVAGELPPGGKWALAAPRDASEDLLAAWAARVLGYPVWLDMDRGRILRGWPPDGLGCDEPACDVWRLP